MSSEENRTHKFFCELVLKPIKLYVCRGVNKDIEMVINDVHKYSNFLPYLDT